MPTLTVPKIIEWGPRPYVAVRREVTIPFGDRVDEAMAGLRALVDRLGVKPAGPPFFKYNLINMPHLVIEVGVPLVEAAPPQSGDEVAGVLPQGRYAMLSYWGPYDNLIDVTAMLMGWAGLHNVEWDSRRAPEGEWFTSRLESYEGDPMEEHDPEKLQTDILIKVR